MKSAYRAAISLNNVAVRCAELGYYKQAVEAFRDAVSMIQVAYEQESGAFNINSKSEFRTVAKLSLSEAAVPSEPNAHVESSLFSSVSDDSDLSAGAALVSSLNIANSKCHLIRIEVYCADGPSLRDFDIDSAIILHNYGLSCLCHSLTSRNQQSAFKLRRNAMKLIRWSQSLLCNRAARSCETDMELADRTLFISLIATKSMAQTLFITGGDSLKVDECLAHLEHLRSAAFENGLVSCLQVTRTVASAA